jgi:cytochrome oxidase Cu insertion factor (SCO1/SenC/PrrC family)
MPAPAKSPPTLPYAVVAVVLALLMFGIAAFVWFGTTARANIGGPFTLQNGDGQTVTNKMFQGRYMLVYFGYTYCPDVCPTTLQSIANAMDKLGPKTEQIVPIFITVDPWRDKPVVVKRYAAAFSPRVVGLTGTPQEIARVEKEYHVYAEKRATGSGEYSMDHSSVIYLMGPDGRFVAPIPESPPESMAAEIGKLVR